MDREQRRLYDIAYRKKYPEKVKGYRTKYYKKNKQKIYQNIRAWQKRNSERINYYQRKYRLKNKDRIKEYESNYRKNKDWSKLPNKIRYPNTSTYRPYKLQNKNQKYYQENKKDIQKLVNLITTHDIELNTKIKRKDTK